MTIPTWPWLTAPWPSPLPVPLEPRRLLIDFATRCNLRCGMCPVWGRETEATREPLLGELSLDDTRKLLDQFTTRPPVAPSIYGEPLLIPALGEVLALLKTRGFPVFINTNGLTLTDAMASALCDLEVDSVMFSLDAVTPSTLAKVRGITHLRKIEAAIWRLLIIRGARAYPRVGVSFTVQDANRHERERFVRLWAPVVDVVRVGLEFGPQGSFAELVAPAERVPCDMLYSSLAVHNDGSVRICCLDGARATNMGNVLRDGLAAVWHGEAFTQARYWHETAQYDRIPFCAPCNGWASWSGGSYVEEVRNGLLVRRNPEFVYYNNLERLSNWTLRGTHQTAWPQSEGKNK